MGQATKVCIFFFTLVAAWTCTLLTPVSLVCTRFTPIKLCVCLSGWSSVGEMLQHLRSGLQVLWLRGPNSATMGTAQALFQQGESLPVQELRLIAPHTDFPFSWLTWGTPHLSSLHIRSAQGLTDDGVEAIVSHCHHLVELHLERCPGVSDSSAVIVCSKMRSLRKLGFPECQKVVFFPLCHTIGIFSPSAE